MTTHAQAISAKANMRFAHVKVRASFSRVAHMTRAARSQNRLHTQKALMEYLLLGG
jgi:hypothetical protein